MNTTIKGLSPAETVKAYPQMRAQPFLQYREQVPGTPLASGAADANGTLVLDLPMWTPIALVRSNGRSILVENATTVVTTL